ncbi:chitobiase/beta-hexosaminidase C-terminal domain-containing protein [Planctomycetota bacterium]
MKLWVLSMIIIVMGIGPPAFAQADITLVINELMASNSSDGGFADPEGDYDDWFEIYNFGEIAIDMGGMYLTDDVSEPNKWQIPDNSPIDTIVSAHGYILIWADNDISDGPLHVGFNLSKDGEQIALVASDGITMIDAIIFSEQITNTSYGRYPDAGDDLRFFTRPTPAAENQGAYLGIVEDPKFSHERGFYNSSFNVTVAVETDGARIYFTTDGSEPLENERPSVTSSEYTSAIRISSTTCLRAAAIKNGWLPSHTMTQTYIFNASEAIKSMPVVSLVGDEYTSFFEPDGIMAIVGGYYDNGGVWRSDGPDSYNNPIQRGREYERPVSFEMIDPRTGINLQMDCGIRVHGSDYTRPRYTRGDEWLSCWNGWPSMNSNKFSFNLFFRSSYGDNRFEYPFFPFIDVYSFQSIALRGGHNDACAPFVKDEWARRLFREMGAAQVTGTFANLYLNGDYKGFYNPTARADQEFFQEWYGTDNEFDVITQSGLRDGTTQEWNDLLNYADSHDLANISEYEYVAGKFDIPTFVDFLILEIHIANFDWPGNNWDVHRERSDTGKFRFSVWDAEGLAETWAVGNNFELTAFEDFPTWSSTPGLNHMSDPVSRLYRALKANAGFRQLFADRVHKHFRNGGILTESHLLDRWWEVFAEVSDVLPETSRHPVRFVPDQFIPNREAKVLKAFADNGLFNLVLRAPVFNINGTYQHGGYVSAGSILTITNPNRSGGLYYTMDGTDPGVPGIPPQQIFETFVAQNAPKCVLVPTEEISEIWKGSRAFNDSSWTQVTGSPGGVGYERSSGYQSYISLDVEAQMYNRYPGCYIRIPFQVNEDLQTYDFVTLKVRYDDGFVAYINGVEVQRAMVSGTPKWNSRSSGGHEADGLQSFDISTHIDALHEGDNILAIHGLNTSLGSSDFLISAELVAGHFTGGSDPSVSETAIPFTGPITINSSVQIKARVFSGDAFSALNEAIFAIGLDQ